MTKSESVREGFAHNSLDLVRLVAALQVMVVHILIFFPTAVSEPLIHSLSYINGVPIFFFVSGFVISASWKRKPEVGPYAAARILRIYPALYTSFVLTFVLLVLLYSDGLRSAGINTLLAWIVSQLSFAQSWNPGFLRDYATGLTNPALWTIPIELAFYVAAPLIIAFGYRTGRPAALLIGIIILSWALNNFFSFVYPDATDQDLLVRKIMLVSPVAAVSWIWMFAVGMLAQHWFERIRPLVERRLPQIIAIAVAVALLSTFVYIPPLLKFHGNNLGLLNFLSLAAVALSFAYRFPDLARKLLKGNDLSYGIYIFHMPIVNGLIALGFTGWSGVGAAMLLTLLVAFASWKLIETPCLALSHRIRKRPRDPAIASSSA